MRKYLSITGVFEFEEMAQESLGVVPGDSQLSSKKKTVVSRSWMLLDSSGHGTLLDLDKYAIMRRFSINARDLRILDPMLSYPSTILGREKAIVLNLEVRLNFLLLLYLCFLVFFFPFFFRFCSTSPHLGSQHIKAIITTEEVITPFFLNGFLFSLLLC